MQGYHHIQGEQPSCHPHHVHGTPIWLETALNSISDATFSTTVSSTAALVFLGSITIAPLCFKMSNVLYPGHGSRLEQQFNGEREFA